MSEKKKPPEFLLLNNKKSGKADIVRLGVVCYMEFISSPEPNTHMGTLSMHDTDGGTVEYTIDQDQLNIIIESLDYVQVEVE